jgi:hypothetical protein
MANIPLIYRTVLGSPLTFPQGDDNLRLLATGSVQSLTVNTASNQLILNRYDNVFPQTQSLSFLSASVVNIGTTPISNPTSGSLWWNTSDGNMYVFYVFNSGGFSGSTWVPAISLAVEAITSETASIVSGSGNNFISGSLTVTGSVRISGSLSTTGSVTITGSLSTTGSISTNNYFVMSNYLLTNFADDTEAALNGVPLGGIYRSGNGLFIRIS